MSIFDQFDRNLPGDSRTRRVQLDKDEYELFPAEEEIFNREQKSFVSFYAAISLVFLLLVVQLLNLQITHGSFNRNLAEGNRIRSRKITAPRGIIYDQKGEALVQNDATFVLQIYPIDLPRSQVEREKFYENLNQISNIPVDEIRTKVKEKGFSSSYPVILRENMPRDDALLLETKIIDLPGVVIAKEPVRHYAEIAGISSVLGYIGKVTADDLAKNRDPSIKMNQNIGKDGLEKIYNQYLQGRDGVNEVEVDSRGRAQRLLATITPQPGNNLILGLNAELERTLSDSLSVNIKAVGARAGAAVAVNPQNGEILGLVSWPTYDNNVFSQGINAEEYKKIIEDKNRPMFNRVVSGAYPSGSTIKPIVAVGGLQEGAITENTTINDVGEIKVGSYTYPDWKTHGLVDVRKAIAVSCNVFFYSIGGGWDKIKGLGPNKLKDYYEKFGLGKKTGIDLLGEVSGLVPDPAWKDKNQHEMWYLGDTYHMAIGQGDVLATPLQMAMAISAIANGGELLKPHMIQKITDNDNKIVLETKKEVTRSNLADAKNIQIVREGMRDCVTADYGSCKALNSLPVAAAAKTGTAQFGNEGKTHGWMVGFAPYDNPQIAIAVIVEGGGEGYASAGPVVKDALNTYFKQ